MSFQGKAKKEGEKEIAKVRVKAHKRSAYTRNVPKTYKKSKK